MLMLNGLVLGVETRSSLLLNDTNTNAPLEKGNEETNMMVSGPGLFLPVAPVHTYVPLQTVMVVLPCISTSLYNLPPGATWTRYAPLLITWTVVEIYRLRPCCVKCMPSKTNWGRPALMTRCSDRNHKHELRLNPAHPHEHEMCSCVAPSLRHRHRWRHLFLGRGN